MPRRAGTLPLIILPIIWCLASALTLRTMGASEGWIPLTAAALAVLAQAWPAGTGHAPPQMLHQMISGDQFEGALM